MLVSHAIPPLHDALRQLLPWHAYIFGNQGKVRHGNLLSPISHSTLWLVFKKSSGYPGPRSHLKFQRLHNRYRSGASLEIGGFRVFIFNNSSQRGRATSQGAASLYVVLVRQYRTFRTEPLARPSARSCPGSGLVPSISAAALASRIFTLKPN